MRCIEETTPVAGATRGQMAATHAIESDDDALNRGEPPASSGARTEVPAQLADAIMSAIRGEAAASAAIRDVRSGCAGVDDLRDALQAVAGARDPELMRAFARRVQKALEQGR